MLRDFDLDNLHYCDWKTADIQNGDLLQFRGSGLIADWIRYATHGCHSHSAMARVEADGRVDCLEVRELAGGRAIPLLGEVAKYPGRIDVFRPRWWLFDYQPAKAVERMRCLTARRYGYGGICRLAMQRVPLIWRLFRLQTSDVEAHREDRAPFCSHAVSIACRAGGVDPVPRKPDDLVTPADLTCSLLFEYICTIK